jgi:hypothetical protein
MAREPSHSETASGQWIVRRESSHVDAASEQQMAMEPSHGKAVSRWRGSHLKARQRAVSRQLGFLCSQATELVAEQRSLGQVCSDRVKVERDSAV